jgi:hypothetical protein
MAPVLITKKQIDRYLELSSVVEQAGKALEAIKKQRNDLKAELVAALKTPHRIEDTVRYRVMLTTAEKRYIPRYKECAIEHAGEAWVDEWVEKHNPHEIEYGIDIEGTGTKALRWVSSKVGAVLDALEKFKAKPAKARAA